MSQSRFNRHIGNKKGMALRWRSKFEPGVVPEDKLTRQRKRALRRLGALIFINENYGPEPRRIRRSMAFMLAKRKGGLPHA
jgi:hypothetical protein